MEVTADIEMEGWGAKATAAATTEIALGLHAWKQDGGIALRLIFSDGRKSSILQMTIQQVAALPIGYFLAELETLANSSIC